MSDTPKRAIVYMITNQINGKKYIGRTVGSVNQRWYKHKKAALKYNIQTVLYSAIRKYGPANFEIDVLASVPDSKNAGEIEKALIKQWGTLVTQGGYNLTEGGDGMWHPSEETRKKMSDSHKGKIPANKGKQMSKETRERISQAKKGVPHKNKRKYTEEGLRRVKERAMQSVQHMIKVRKERYGY